MRPVRLRSVCGVAGRHNDVVFCPPTQRPPATEALLFFGGDVQDYPEVMKTHKDNKNYLKWNLEDMAVMLGNDFPTKHILIVRPARIEYKSFSCYDNFVPSNSAGVPDHTPTHSALQYMQSLLRGVSSRLQGFPATELMEALTSTPVPEEIDIEDLHKSTIKSPQSTTEESAGRSPHSAHPAHPAPEIADPLWWRENLKLEQSSLTLVGFSKGCVVLNQFIYEFHYTQTLTPGDDLMMRFISQIESMYWLDGGHAGGKNTWITARSLLETLARLDISIYVHVSPYQVRDETRPWIGREERAFTSMLRILGARIQRHVHGAGAACLLMHFGVLSEFRAKHDN